MEYYSVIKNDPLSFGSFVEIWMDLEYVIWNEVRKKKTKYCILMHICEIQKNGLDETTYREGRETQPQGTNMQTQGKGEDGVNQEVRIDIHTTLCKIDAQWEPAVQPRELSLTMTQMGGSKVGWEGICVCTWLIHGAVQQKLTQHIVKQFHCCSASKSSPTLCSPMNCSASGFLALHFTLEFAQILSIELVIPSNHLFLCHPFLLLPSIFPSIRVSSNESSLHKIIGSQIIGPSTSAILLQ